jgi:ferredoxin
MAKWPSPGRASTARINGRADTVAPRETLLRAALRQGIAFPHGCRVGGCATCKCRLVEGRVRELTESAYLLSDDELDRGFILACQSVPTTDVGIEVERAGPARPAPPEGPVPGRERAGPDLAGQRELPEAAAGPDVEAPGTAAPGRRVEAQPGGALHHLKYFLFHAVELLSAAVLLAGGHLVTLGLLALLARGDPTSP